MACRRDKSFIPNTATLFPPYSPRRCCAINSGKATGDRQAAFARLSHKAGVPSVLHTGVAPAPYDGKLAGMQTSRIAVNKNSAGIIVNSTQLGG